MEYIKPDWPAPSHIKAYTTLRDGWGGRLAHHDTNRGNFIMQHPEYVKESKSLEALLNLPNEPIWITQTHSTIAIEAHPNNKEKMADASYTDQPERVCVVMTADCLPVLLCNKQGTHVAAIHAGWRGLANGIIEATIAALQQQGEDLLAWLGPAIGPTKFEVGDDVYNAFNEKDPHSAPAFKLHTPGKWFADLYQLAKIRLKKQHISCIYGGNFCTYSQKDLFFSYRRENGRTGRMASLIWIDGP